MGFQASTYGLNFCPDFLELFLKIEKFISFVGILFFSQSVLRNKSYAQINSKQGRVGSKRNLQNFELLLNFFFL